MKTIEQAAEEFTSGKLGKCDSSLLMKAKRCCNISFKAGVEFANRWISIENELPKKGETFLTKFKAPVNPNGNGETMFGLSIRLTQFDQECRYNLREQGVAYWRKIELE